MLAVPAVPQESGGQGPVIRSQVNLLNVFATVRDKNKRIVGDLKQEDFKIIEDNQDQKISFFSKEVSLPITLALLLDTSGSEQDMLGAIQAGEPVLDRVLRKGDEALVMSFDTDVDMLSDFTDDRAQLDRAVRRARLISGGGMIAGILADREPADDWDGAYDAIYWRAEKS
jgi:VWFA-related protein